MFGFLFGWHKASKCKKLIKRVQCRITMLKSRRNVIARQLREDIGELLKIGNEESAFNRVEQLIKDENTMAVYELIHHFCEFININLSYIRKNKDCPNDINEAISTLIFASSRCGDLPELPRLRKLFGERYGQQFSKAAVEKFTGNLVNNEIKEKFSLNPVPDHMKYRLLDEISKDYCMRPHYTSKLQKKVNENKEKRVVQVKDIQTCPKQTDESKNNVGPLLSSTEFSSRSHPTSDAITTSITSSIVHQSSQDTLESPENRNFGQMGSRVELTSTGSGGVDSQETGMISTTVLKHINEKINTKTSSESSSMFHEDKILYLDDVKEDKTLDEKSVSAKSVKRSKRKLIARENFNVNDVESAIYYDNLEKIAYHRENRKHSSSQPKSQPRKTQMDKSSQRKSQPRKTQMESETQSRNLTRKSNRETSHCSLDQPCYFGMCGDKDYIETHTQKRDNLLSKQSEKLGQGYDVRGTFGFSTELGGKPIRSEVQRGKIPPYSRAKTMPQKKAKENCGDGILRSRSCSFENHLDHVHPKLPDYEDIAEKFNALKKHHFENKAMSEEIKKI